MEPKTVTLDPETLAIIQYYEHQEELRKAALIGGKAAFKLLWGEMENGKTFSEAWATADNLLDSLLSEQPTADTDNK